MMQVIIQIGIRTKAQVLILFFSQKQPTCIHNGEFRARYIGASNIV